MNNIQQLRLDKDLTLHLPNPVASYLDCNFVEATQNEDKVVDKPLNDIQLPLAESKLYYAKILSTKILSKGENVKTRIEIFLDIKDDEFNFLPGDSIAIIPENTENEVDELLKLLNLIDVSDKLLHITLKSGINTKKKVPNYIPEYITPRKLFENCLDLRSIVKKLFIQALLNYATEPTEKRRLEELCSREGAAEYHEFIVEKSTCILDILQNFPSCKPPLSLLIEHLPRLMPRPYSIASSPLQYTNSIRIVFSLVEDIRGRNGLCTNWLYVKVQQFLDVAVQMQLLNLNEQQNKQDNKIPMYLRKSTKFRIPENLNTSLIMIGPGTGICPFIGFLEHRNKQIEKLNQIDALDNILLFGCRYKNQDFIYKEELEFYKSQNILKNLFVCFSRENNEDELKYVQHLFNKEKRLLINLLMKENTYLFICGDAFNMAKDLEKVIVECISEVQDISKEEASNILKIMETDGKFVKDVWR